MDSQCRMKCNFVCGIEGLLLLLIYEFYEACLAYMSSFNEKENHNRLILVSQKH